MTKREFNQPVSGSRAVHAFLADLDVGPTVEESDLQVFELFSYSHLYCWISTIWRPAGPRTAPTRDSLTSMSILAIASSRPGPRGSGLPAVARPKELLLMGRGKEAGASGKPGNPGGDVGRKFDGRSVPGAAATKPVGPYGPATVVSAGCWASLVTSGEWVASCKAPCTARTPSA